MVLGIGSLVTDMQSKLKGGSRVNRKELYTLCLVLSKAIDRMLRRKDTLNCKQELLQLLKQIARLKEDNEVRPAIMVLMISFKSAAQHGWFTQSEAADLLQSVNPLFEVFNSFPSSTDTNMEQLADVLLRFHPWSRLEKVLLSYEAKPGYEGRLFDLYIDNRLGDGEQVLLFAIKNENLETPACLVTPPLVSFLINGKSVDKRTISSMDNGPQAPTDCTELLKTGGNILQIVGEFQSHYTVVLAVTASTRLLGKESLLEMQPLALHSDDEITEGPSKVSLCCPLSRKRIATPVKGATCKHLQCFDFDTYMKLNQIRPSWRCPTCEACVTCNDLRLDKRTAKILEQAGGLVSDILIANDGSWVLPVPAPIIELETEEADWVHATPPVPRPVSFRASPSAMDYERKPSVAGIRNRTPPFLRVPRQVTPPSHESVLQWQQQFQQIQEQQQQQQQLLLSPVSVQQIQELQLQWQQQQIQVPQLSQQQQIQEQLSQQQQQQHLSQQYAAPVHDPQLWQPFASTSSTRTSFNGAGLQARTR